MDPAELRMDPAELRMDGARFSIHRAEPRMDGPKRPLHRAERPMDRANRANRETARNPCRTQDSRISWPRGSDEGAIRIESHLLVCR